REPSERLNRSRDRDNQARRPGAGQFVLARPVVIAVMLLSMGDLRPLPDDRRMTMARKPATRAEFTLFDVVYEDGSLRSNRRVPSEVLGGLDGDAPARAVIEEQDRLIADKFGVPALVVKSIHRSGSKKVDETMRSPRYASASN